MSLLAIAVIVTPVNGLLRYEPPNIEVHALIHRGTIDEPPPHPHSILAVFIAATFTLAIMALLIIRIEARWHPIERTVLWVRLLVN